MKRISGFTLLELMVVVIIIAVLAAIALPRFVGGVERARVTEASNFMQAVREEHNVYLASTPAGTTSFTTLGFITGSGITIAPATTATGRYFTFTTTAAGTTTATRRDIPAGNDYDGNTITLDINGTWGGGATPHPLRPTNE